MKHKVKRQLSIIILIITLLVVVFVIICLSHNYEKTTYEMRFNRQSLSSERMFIRYYDSLGYFPRSRDEVVTFVQRNFYSYDTEENIRARQMFEDLLSKDGGDIAYIPLYDYETKIPTSFIFLSAGIDGKLDNQISPSDTLYTNTWWHDLDIYNYEEAILVQDFWRKNKEWNLLLSEGEKYLEYYPPYPDLEPRFSMMKYLFGKKDWVIQIGLIDY